MTVEFNRTILYFCQKRYYEYHMLKKVLPFIFILEVMCLSVEARPVKGTVKSGKERLAGVIVTDGVNFTATRRNGSFSFEIADSAEFVYLVTPSGYCGDWSSGVPAFYMPASGRDWFDFQLQRLKYAEPYHIVAIADPQPHTDSHFAEFAGEPLSDLGSTAASLEGQTVGLALGDISWDRIELLDRFKENIVKTGIPFYPVIGNHDHEVTPEGDRRTSESYRKKMGPANYAFCLGNDVVIVLDNIVYEVAARCITGYTDEIISWVRELLKWIPSDSVIYVAQHAPLGHEGGRVGNEDVLLDILRGRKVEFLSGHNHVNHNSVISENVFSHNIAAICGAWWDTEHCIDGSPRGYKVFTKSADSLSWYYKPVAFGREYIAELIPSGGVEEYPDAVIANVWDWDPCWKVEWYEDGVYKGPMKQINIASPVYVAEIQQFYGNIGKPVPNWKRPRPSVHNFAAHPSPEAKQVTVVVQTRFGQKWQQTVWMNSGNINRSSN